MISLNSHFTNTNTYIPIQEYYSPNQSYIENQNATPSREGYSVFQDKYSKDIEEENSTYSFDMALSNDTFTEYAEIPYYIKTTSMTFCIAIMCLGVIGNVMVPIVILKTKDMRNSTNIFLVNLSIADLMVLLVCTPTVLVEVNSKPETWVLGKELCLAVPFVELTVAHASVLTILAISFERYYAICEPLRAGYVCTKTRATLICALAWFFAALFTSPILGIAEHRLVENKDGRFYGQCLTQAVTFWPILFFIMIILLLFIFPLIILIVLYSVIAKNLITAASKVVLNKTFDPYNARARKQVILMLGTVVLCFFICLMPFRILTLWIIVAPSEHVEDMNPEKFYNILYFSRIMLYINSAINPILYNLMSSKFRIGFCKMCICGPSSNANQNGRTHRHRTGTLTTGSTTSSSLTRTTNSLKKLFSARNSLDRSNTTKSDTDSESNHTSLRSNEISTKEYTPKIRQNAFLAIFSNRTFKRQQSAPVCTNSRTDMPSHKINRMLSEGNVLELSCPNTLDIVQKINPGTNEIKRDDNKVGKNAEINIKISQVDDECCLVRHNHGSLRRSVLLNSAKSRSVDESKKIKQNFKVSCSVTYKKSKSADCESPESFV